MPQEYPHLNEPDVNGSSVPVVLFIPNRASEDLPEYIIHLSPINTILDLKKVLKNKLATKPKTFDIRIIYLGKIKENHEFIKDVLKKKDEGESDDKSKTDDKDESKGYPHFHVMINNVPPPTIKKVSKQENTNKNLTPSFATTKAQTLNISDNSLNGQDYYNNSSTPISGNILSSSNVQSSSKGTIKDLNSYQVPSLGSSASGFRSNNNSENASTSTSGNNFRNKSEFVANSNSVNVSELSSSNNSRNGPGSDSNDSSTNTTAFGSNNNLTGTQIFGATSNSTNTPAFRSGINSTNAPVLGSSGSPISASPFRTTNSPETPAFELNNSSGTSRLLATNNPDTPMTGITSNSTSRSMLGSHNDSNSFRFNTSMNNSQDPRLNVPHNPPASDVLRSDADFIEAYIQRIERGGLIVSEAAKLRFAEIMKKTYTDNLQIQLQLQPTTYQHVKINGRNYLLKTPTGTSGAENPVAPRETATSDPNRTRRTRRYVIRRVRRERASVLRTIFRYLRIIWPAIKIAFKLALVYFFTHIGGDIYKQILFGIVVLIFFIFSNGIIDVQIEFGRVDEANNQQQDQQHNGNENNDLHEDINEGNEGELAPETPPAPPREPRHPLIEGAITFFSSILPERPPQANRNNEANANANPR
ncbi:hypothetical protein K502DRAFT_338887 [Neoconidiobolus thromboides FSU 785]|nr:hypothetical protein K502DRAFT_338887 [Neoconidiobolus thromboides FSU 785]